MTFLTALTAFFVVLVLDFTAFCLRERARERAARRARIESMIESLILDAMDPKKRTRSPRGDVAKWLREQVPR